MKASVQACYNAIPVTLTCCEQLPIKPQLSSTLVSLALDRANLPFSFPPPSPCPSSLPTQLGVLNESLPPIMHVNYKVLLVKIIRPLREKLEASRCCSTHLAQPWQATPTTH